MRFSILVLFFNIILFQCAYPRHMLIGDMDNTTAKKKHFRIMVSERGYDFEQGLAIAQVGLLAANAESNAGNIRNIEYVKLAIALSTMGPTTGRKLFNSAYTDQLADIIFQHCKSGNIVNLRSIRESLAQYPVVSGEVVRIEGDCLDVPKIVEETKDSKETKASKETKWIKP
jgi:hypothetical protein